MNHIEVIALLCVYSVALIIASIKLPTYIVTIKKQCKTRKIQKHKKLKNTVETIVFNYLKELSNERQKETTQTKDKDCRVGETKENKEINEGRENIIGESRGHRLEDL